MSDLEWRIELLRLAEQVYRARGEQAKLDACARMLAFLEIIAPTPGARNKWIKDLE